MASPLFMEGLTDAVGFVGGSLAGFWLGKTIGFDLFAPGYSSASMIGIALVGLGGGLGVQGARRWQALRESSRKD